MPGRIREMIDAAALTGCETLNAASHEQYTFPYYPNYVPDHMERLAAAARGLVIDGGCKPVFFSEGLLGNTAWGD